MIMSKWKYVAFAWLGPYGPLGRLGVKLESIMKGSFTWGVSLMS